MEGTVATILRQGDTGRPQVLGKSAASRCVRPMNREAYCMTASVASSSVPWWKEPTKDQWYAYIAAWLGWTLDAFDFTVFLLIMVPISQEFGVPLIDVTAIFSVTLIMRLGGATA